MSQRIPFRSTLPLLLIVLGAVAVLTPLAAQPGQTATPAASSGDVLTKNEQNGSEDEEPQEPQDPSEEIMERILGLVRESSDYRRSNLFELTEEMQTRLNGLKDESPFEIRIRTRSFVRDELEWVEVTHEGWDLAIEWSRQHRGLVAKLVNPEGDEASYKISETDVEPLEFTYVYAATVVFPLNRPLETFQVEDERFDRVIEQLAQAANVTEVAYDASGAADKSVTIRLHNRSIAEIFELVSFTVNWEVVYHRFRTSGRGLQRREVDAPENEQVYLRDFKYAYEDRDRLSYRSDADIETPADVVAFVLSRCISRVERNLVIVTVRPRGENDE